MDINNDISSIISDALMDIITIVSGFSLEVLSEERDDEFYDMTGVMIIYGDINGVFFVSANEADMRLFCSYMTGVPIEDIKKEDYIDAMSEFANMTAGSAKLRLGNSEYIFTLSSPYILESKEMSISTKKKVSVLSTTFGKSDIKIKMKLVY